MSCPCKSSCEECIKLVADNTKMRRAIVKLSCDSGFCIACEKNVNGPHDHRDDCAALPVAVPPLVGP